MNLFKSFSTFAFFNILNAAIPFLLLPILTKYLTPADYGLLTNVDVFFRFTLPFIILGVNSAINTAYFRMEKSELPAYISTGVIVSFLSSLFFLVLFFCLSPVFEKFIHIPFFWLLIAPFYCFFQSISQINLGLFQVSKEPIKYGTYQVSMTLVNLTLSIMLVAFFKLGWNGRLTGILATYFVFMIVGLIYLYKKKMLIAKFSKPFAKDILYFGIPLLPHLLAGPLIQFSDRFFITTYAGNYWTGIYNVAFQIGTSISLITLAFNQAWVPFLYEKLGSVDERGKVKIIKQSYLLMLAFWGLALLLLIFTPIIYHFFINQQFIDSKQFVLTLSIGSVFGGMYYLVTNYIFYEKKTYILSWITISNGILSVLLNLFLVRKFGAWGAAYTYLFTNMFLFFSVWVLSNKVFPMPWFFFLRKNTTN